jgi:hypothetical protein
MDQQNSASLRHHSIDLPELRNDFEFQRSIDLPQILEVIIHAERREVGRKSLSLVLIAEVLLIIFRFE